MAASTLLSERPTQPEVWLEPTPRPRRASPILVMVSGLVITALAVVTLVATTTTTTHSARPTPRPADPTAITLAARDVSVVTQVYEPGETSGWHLHPGIHAVAVLSGVLTVYDGDCRRQTFEPGHPYVGGQQVHLVRNETDAPVTMIVTYLNPTVPANSSRHVPPPAGCAIG